MSDDKFIIIKSLVKTELQNILKSENDFNDDQINNFIVENEQNINDLVTRLIEYTNTHDLDLISFKFINIIQIYLYYYIKCHPDDNFDYEQYKVDVDMYGYQPYRITE